MLMEPRVPKVKEAVEGMTYPRHHCSVKRDGWQVRLCKDRFGRVFAWSRKPLELTEKLRDTVAYERMLLEVPLETQVVGELWLPGAKASSVITAMNERPRDLVFELYAVEYVGGQATFAGEDAAYAERFAVVHGFDYPPAAAWSPVASALPPDCEGFVLKAAHLSGWLKWKPTATVDLVVLGFKDGKKANLGLIGSLECGLPDGTVICNCSGMTFDERYEMSRGDWKRHLGRVVEVEYQYVGDGGKGRHPRFVRWRDDKSSSQVEDPR